MKKNICYIILPLLCLLASSFFTGCQKSPINGHLDGMWQVMEVDPKPQQEIIRDRLYYNFSLHVCTLSYYGGGLTVGNLTYDGDRITMDFPAAQGPETRLKMRQYGIYTNPVTFDVVYLDKNKLIIENPYATVELRKF